MICQMVCIGTILKEPKRSYLKAGNEISHFLLSVKRNYSGNETWDVFRFEAWGPNAKYINDYLHHGDMIGIISRPRRVNYKKNNGETVNDVVFRVTSIQFICHKERVHLKGIGGTDFPEFPEFIFQNRGNSYDKRRDIEESN